jgi:hypothetical protein
MSPADFKFEGFSEKEEFKETEKGHKIPTEIWKAAEAFRRIAKYFANDKK